MIIFLVSYQNVIHNDNHKRHEERKTSRFVQRKKMKTTDFSELYEGNQNTKF